MISQPHVISTWLTQYYHGNKVSQEVTEREKAQEHKRPIKSPIQGYLEVNSASTERTLVWILVCTTILFFLHFWWEFTIDQAKGASKRASSFISVNKELEQAKLLTDLLIFLISFINLNVSYLINCCLLPLFNFLADSVDEEWSQSAVHVYVWSSSAFANFSDVY